MDLDQLVRQLASRIPTLLNCQQAALLIVDDENSALRFGAASSPLNNPQTYANLHNLRIPLYNIDQAPIIGHWLAGEPVNLTASVRAEHLGIQWLLDTLGFQHGFSQPLRYRKQLLGVILADLPAQTADTSPNPVLLTLTLASEIMLQNACAYSKTVRQAETHMRELNILRQIDRELNDTIEPHHVFQMTLDWALRFTNAHAASLGLYDQDSDDFRVIATYGYDIPPEQAEMARMQRGGIAQRVARSSHAEIVPDVSMDKDFIQGASLTQSQLSVPVMREDRVIAVISVESRKINGFTEEHLSFIEKLAARAGVAIDNARLFDTTSREREKLSHILNNTADVVIVFGLDERIILINPSAYAALRLYTGQDYTGQPFSSVFADTALSEAYQRARGSSDPLIDEVQLPNGRTFHLNFTCQENVGWIIVMHDITPFKEMDRLKSELIATVSHDLKQPLAVMNGYIELLLMHKKLDEIGINFLDMVRRSIHNMRQLIDDLLDLAKIESGIQLDLQPVDSRDLINECIDALQPSIMTKAMQVMIDFPPQLPPLLADRARLQQILLNLISNAVKYTQPEGWVRVSAEQRDRMLRIEVQDNGLGISPEDQVHIFERFYRVRRPETDSIEGTGLGLAIVKTLVEAHRGTIGLESRLGEGTTFYLMLPTAPSTDPVPSES